MPSTSVQRLAITLVATIVVVIAVQLGRSHVAAAPDPLCGSITANLTLTADLDCTGKFGTALIIDADGITIDGQGHSILAPNASTVVSIGNHTSVSVINVTLVGGSSIGIYVSGGSGNVISGVDVSGSGPSRLGEGIQFNSGSNNTTTNVTASNRFYGIRVLFASSGNTFRGNAITDNYYGIYALQNTGQGNLFFDNDLTNNAFGALLIANDSSFQESYVSGNDFNGSGAGLALQGIDGVVLTQAIGQTNNFSGAIGGISLSNLDGATVSNLDLGDVQRTYLSLGAVTNSTISDFSVTGANTFGIVVSGGGGNVISGVDVSWSGQSPSGWGIYFSGSSNTTTTNVTSTNRRFAIEVIGASSGNTFHDNAITGNQYGIYGPRSTGQGNLYLDNDLTDNAAGVALLIANDPSFQESYVSGNDFSGSGGLVLQGIDGVVLTQAIGQTNNFNGALGGIGLSSLDGATVSNLDLGEVQRTYLSLGGVTNSTISDFSVSGANTYGIYVSLGGGNVFSGIDVSWSGPSPSGQGILFNTTSNNTTTNVTSSNRGFGVRVQHASSGNIFQGNAITGNQYGIYALESTGQGNLFFDNDLTGNAVGWGLAIGNDTSFQESYVSGNDFSGSGGLVLQGIDGLVLDQTLGQTNNFNGALGGIGLSSLDGATVSNLDLGDVQRTYLSLGGVTNSTISDIYVTGANTYGIYVTGGGWNVFSGIDVSWSGPSPSGQGILFNTTSNNTTTNVTSSNRGFGVRVQHASSGNIFQGNATTGNQYGIYALESTGQGNLFFDNDLTDNAAGYALAIANDTSFQESHVSGNDFSGSGWGLVLQGIDGVVLTQAIGQTNNFNGALRGIALSSLDGATVSNLALGDVQRTYLGLGGVTNSTVADFSVIGSNTFGISVSGGGGNVISDVDVSWSGPAPSGEGIRFNTTSNNTTTNVTSSNRGFGIRVFGASPDNTFQCGSFIGNNYGLYFQGSLGSTTTSVNLSRFEGNTFYGVFNTTAGLLNAENNYWGRPDGPRGPGLTGSGDLVSANVDAVPFFTNPQELGPLCGDNTPPDADAGPDQAVDEGAIVTLNAGGTTDPNDDPLTFAWELVTTTGPVVALSDANAVSPTFVATDNGVLTFGVTVDDGFGGVDSDEVVVTVSNVAPTIAVSGAASVDEGSPYTLTLGAVTDPGDDTVAQYVVDWGDGATSTTTSGGDVTHSYANGPASYDISVDLVDEDGTHVSAGSFSVTVNNVAPTVGAIAAPTDQVQVNTLVEASATFFDPGQEDTHTAVWDWGDATTTPGTLDGANVTGTHAYSAPGVYTVTVTVADNHGDSGQSAFQFVVVYDATGGFVTGGGWIESPAGSYAADPTLTGRANFGFVSKYKRGATVPTGQTQFRYRVAGLNFHSASYQWLVIAGARAQFKGTGTINGAGNYGFMLTAIDGAVNGGGGADRFRIKIWDIDNGGGVVYDNQMGDADNAGLTNTLLKGGSIVIHNNR